MKYFITGASGHLGHYVVEALSKLTDKANIRLGVHNPAKAQALTDAGYEVVPLDYYKVDTMIKAFSGVDLVIYIPSITYNVADRIKEFENSLAAMKKAGVENIVDVSFMADQADNPFQMTPTSRIPCMLTRWYPTCQN